MRSNQKEMPILDHIRELRNIILISLFAYAVACVLAFIFSNRIISLFTEPFRSVESLVNRSMVVSSIVEGFATQIRITVIAGLILSLPVHLFGIIRFVFPGLTNREKRIVMSFLIVSLILIVVGSYFVYFMIIPMVVAFLTGPYFVPSTVGFLLNYQTNIFYLLTFILCSVLALQAPIIMEILMILNIIQRRQVLRACRYIVAGIFILSAIITPPDFISQLAVALPLTALFFTAILIAKIFKFGEG
jgi:sec-independent protein translocase protein TatC